MTEKRARRTYSEEQKKQLVELFNRGKPRGEIIREREYSIQRDFVATETQKKQAEENYKNGVMTVVWVAVGIAVVLGIFYGILFSSF